MSYESNQVFSPHGLLAMVSELMAKDPLGAVWAFLSILP